MTDPDAPHLRIRIRFGGDAFIGPGKAELLERIAATGSIAAAARDMGMSYKRAWMIVETLNAKFGGTEQFNFDGETVQPATVLDELKKKLDEKKADKPGKKKKDGAAEN